MERICHPQSGKDGFFVTVEEKSLIDVIFRVNQSGLQLPHSVGDGLDE